MKIDPAIARALSIDPNNTSVTPHGNSSFANSAKITCRSKDGTERHYFQQTGPGRAASIMFEGEFASLNAIHQTVPSLCPAALAHGMLEDTPDSHFLVTDFLVLKSKSLAASTKTGSGMTLAAKLAKLHTTPAPVPDGYDRPVFGFPVPTCCGSTPQPNDYKESWADFYAENRLRAILEKSEKANGRDEGLRSLVEKVVGIVVPRLLGDDHLNNGRGVIPVVVHGDLWSGNKGWGKIADSEDWEDVVFDPSACYAHSEYELGIMQMFGGFGSAFFREYHQLCPKSEPVEEYEDRVSLYELYLPCTLMLKTLSFVGRYHHLNHYSLFGGSYKSGAVSIMNRLLKKYDKRG